MSEISNEQKDKNAELMVQVGRTIKVSEHFAQKTISTQYGVVHYDMDGFYKKWGLFITRLSFEEAKSVLTGE